jgi:cation diffusion facilitator family transporter
VERDLGLDAKRRAATASLATNTGLTVLKLVAAALTASISLLSEAAHSATDVVASALTYASVQAAAAPPDDEHNYGHGKIESLAGFGESILLGAIVIYIVFESIPRFGSPKPIAFPAVGMGVMALSSMASLFVGLYVRKVGTQTESLSLQVNGRHLTIDFWTSCGVLAALVLNKVFSWHQADPVMALLLAAWIARNAWLLAQDAFQQLIDRRVSDDELKLIHEALDGDERILSYHKLRTRHSGSCHYVDVHVVVPRDQTLLEAHEVADGLESRIEAVLSPAQVVVHVDPFDPSKATG